MNNNFQYRLSNNQKNEIAQNLIDFLQKDTEITEETREFICDWILTGPDEKRKAFFDVWDIVLKNYLPTTRPILFRACERLGKNGKIASFTGQLRAARKFSDGRGSIIVCDTKELLQFEEQLYQPGQYEHTFYPLRSVLEKARALGGCGFRERFLDEYIGEDEYIMRIDLDEMYCFKWMKDFHLNC